MSSRIGRMRDNHGGDIEEIEKRLRILRLRARFAAARDRSNKMADHVESNSDHLHSRYESRRIHQDQESRAVSNRQSRSQGSRGGILDTGLCALPYQGFADRLFGSESEDEEYIFSDDDNSALEEEDRSDEDDVIVSRVPPPSSSRQNARVPQTERRYVAPSSLQPAIPDVARTTQKPFQDQQHFVPLTVTRDFSSTTSPVLAREQASASTGSSRARSMQTKTQEHSTLSIKTSDTKKTWLNRLKCQSHADKDNIWIPKNIPHILPEYDNAHWNVYNDRKVNESNVLRVKPWNQDDSSTIATCPSGEWKQQRAVKTNQTRGESKTPSNAPRSQQPFDGHSFENATPTTGSRIKSNRSRSTGRAGSLQSSSGSRSRVSTTQNQEITRVGTGHSRKSTSGSKSRSTPKKISRPLTLDLRLSASDDSADPYDTVRYFQTGYGQPRTATGAITPSWW